VKRYLVVVIKNKKPITVINSFLEKETKIDELGEISYIYYINFENQKHVVKSATIDLSKIPCCKFKNLYIEIIEEFKNDS